jgi:NAD kinase
VFVLLIVVVGTFIRICAKLRRGGGSLTTIVLGATDGFLTHEKSKAVETIVNENVGKKFVQLPSTDPPNK